MAVSATVPLVVMVLLQWWVREALCSLIHGCEGDLLRISCPANSNTMILIRSAMYGKRPGTPTAPYRCGDRTTLTRKCDTDITFLLKYKCEGKSKCDVTVDQNAFEAEFCPDVMKYAEVQYECVPQATVDAVQSCSNKCLPPPSVISLLVAKYNSAGTSKLTASPANNPRPALPKATRPAFPPPRPPPSPRRPIISPAHRPPPSPRHPQTPVQRPAGPAKPQVTIPTRWTQHPFQPPNKPAVPSVPSPPQAKRPSQWSNRPFQPALSLPAASHLPYGNERFAAAVGSANPLLHTSTGARRPPTSQSQTVVTRTRQAGNEFPFSQTSGRAQPPQRPVITSDSGSGNTFQGSRHAQGAYPPPPAAGNPNTGNRFSFPQASVRPALRPRPATSSSSRSGGGTGGAAGNDKAAILARARALLAELKAAKAARIAAAEAAAA